jgi:hypothetical protein
MKLGQNDLRMAVCAGLQPDGWFHGSVVSRRGKALGVEAVATLPDADWQRIASMTNHNGLIGYYDPNASPHPSRFYRARELGP